MIELRTLGMLELRDAEGRDLCRELQPKRLALLIYLAHTPRRYHRRDSLVALFWPELDPGSARNSLRQSLYELRRTLGKGVVTRRGYQEIGVAEPLLWSDVVALESALEAGQAERALDLYRGDLLEGFHVQNVAPEFEHWLETERVRLRNKALRAALGLVHLEEALGRPAPAVRWARTAGRIDPDNEGVLRKLIALLDQAGDPAGAIRAYDAFARRTRTEYDLEPAKETQRLIQGVRARSEAQEPPTSLEPGILEPPTTFIGRERELAELERLLMDPETRLVTLTGLGGSGKTRLALQFSRRVEEHFEGVALIGLGDVRQVDEMLSAIAHGLGLREEGSHEPREALHRYLTRRKFLLVLDGLERVQAAGPSIVSLLQAAPQLKILSTRPGPLKVSGEWEFPVPPLGLPQPGLSASVEFPLNSEAIALFVDRARAVRPDFRLTAKNLDAVSEICRRLDGLPLAIELAAARVKALTPYAVAQRLGERFALLTGGPADQPPRHQTLEAAIGWSYDLLDEAEQKLFRQLGVFADGFGLDLAEPLFEAYGVSTYELIDGLASLVDHSLVRQLGTAGEPRFEMLDTVHAYASKLLAESGEGDAWCHQHAKRVVNWVEDGERHYCTPEQNSWLQGLERENDNIRAALRWSLEHGKASIAVRLGAALWPFWYLHGHLVEARSWLEKILRARGKAPRVARAKVLLGASWMASEAAEHDRAAEHANESAALYRAAGDRVGYIRALETLGFVQLEAGRIESAESAFMECLERSRLERDDRRQAIALDALGQVALARNDDLRAESLFRESVALARRIGHVVSVGTGLLCLGDVARRSGGFDRATGLYEEALGLYRETGQKINIAWALSCLGRALVEGGGLAAARESYAEALPLFRELEYVRGMARTLTGFAAIALAQGDAERAVMLLGGIQGLLERAGDQFAADDAAAFEGLQAAARERLRTSRFSTRWTEGRSLEADALITLAVEQGPPLFPQPARARVIPLQ